MNEFSSKYSVSNIYMQGSVNLLQRTNPLELTLCSTAKGLGVIIVIISSSIVIITACCRPH